MNPRSNPIHWDNIQKITCQDCQVCAEQIGEEDGRHDDGEPDEGPVGEKVVVVVSDCERVHVPPSKPTHEEADENQNLCFIENVFNSLTPLTSTKMNM